MVEIMENYRAAQEGLADVSVIIKDNENDLDPLTLLRACQGDKSLEAQLDLAAKFIVGKEVSFAKDGKELLRFTHKSGNLADRFREAPWLLDVLLSVTQGMLLKKLTPPSVDSVTVVSGLAS
jgi:hypothetical protein